jgi:hypothetical protein
MNPVDLIEKLINEHGSFNERLELLRDQVSVLEKENGALKSENAILKSKGDTMQSQLNKAMKEIERLNQGVEGVKKDDAKAHFDVITEKVLKLFFDKGQELSVEGVAALLSMDINTARYHFDLLLERKLIIQTTLADKSSWTSKSTPALFELTYLGRKYVIENKPT